jgi:hypothetical protein
MSVDVFGLDGGAGAHKTRDKSSPPVSDDVSEDTAVCLVLARHGACPVLLEKAD